MVENNAPPVLEALYSGATLEEIRETEEELGITFPPDVVEFYLRHNGEVSEGVFCLGGMLFPLSIIIEQRDILAANMNSEKDDLVDTVWLVRKNRYNVMWIPFVGADGTDLCLDFARSAGGEKGQVIYKEREGSREVIAKKVYCLVRRTCSESVKGSFPV